MMARAKINKFFSVKIIHRTRENTWEKENTQYYKNLKKRESIGENKWHNF